VKTTSFYLNQFQRYGVLKMYNFLAHPVCINYANRKISFYHYISTDTSLMLLFWEACGILLVSCEQSLYLLISQSVCYDKIHKQIKKFCILYCHTHSVNCMWNVIAQTKQYVVYNVTKKVIVLWLSNTSPIIIFKCNFTQSLTVIQAYKMKISSPCWSSKLVSKQ